MFALTVWGTCKERPFFAELAKEAPVQGVHVGVGRDYHTNRDSTTKTSTISPLARSFRTCLRRTCLTRDSRQQQHYSLTHSVLNTVQALSQLEFVDVSHRMYIMESLPDTDGGEGNLEETKPNHFLEMSPHTL